MRAIICNDLAELNTIQSRIFDQRKVEGHVGGKTTACINPLYHPIDGRVALTVGQYKDYLTEEELDRVVELPEDWFPVIEE